MLTATQMALQVLVYPTGPLQANCYLVYDEGSMEAAIIDPGAKNAGVTQAVKAKGLSVKYILATHAHFDHVFGAGYFKAQFPKAVVACHKLDAAMWQQGPKFAYMFGVAAPSDFPAAADQWFDNDFTFLLGAVEFSVIHTPGHTPGGVCFYSASQNMIFSGDTLFYGSIGRTDFPGSSPAQMSQSIARLDAKVPRATLLYPGHDTAGEQFGEAIDVAKTMV